MVALNSNKICRRFAREHPDQFGFLFSPSYFDANRLKENVAYAVDNDAYNAFKENKAWDDDAFFKTLDAVAQLPWPPLWVLVPDVVGNRKETLKNWERYSERVRSYGFHLAFAVQDGMVCSDVPTGVTIFVGGSTEWKWSTAPFWCASFPTHIGRVNSLRRLQQAEEMGAVSTDGSGWHRDKGDWDRNFDGLDDWFKGWRNRQQKLAI